MHLLNAICCQLLPQTVVPTKSGSASSSAAAAAAANLNVDSIDEKLCSSLFDDDSTVGVPNYAFELLFGSHRYDVESLFTANYNACILCHVMLNSGPG